MSMDNEKQAKRMRALRRHKRICEALEYMHEDAVITKAEYDRLYSLELVNYRKAREAIGIGKPGRAKRQRQCAQPSCRNEALPKQTYCGRSCAPLGHLWNQLDDTDDPEDAALLEVKT